jgi:hypothetical protein
MLDRTTNSHREIQLRRNILPCLPDLQTVIGKATVNSGTGGTNRSAKRVSEGHHDAVEFLLGLETAAAGDDAAGRGEVGPLGFGELLGDPFGLRGGLRVDTLCDFGVAACGFGVLEGGAADGDDFDGIGGLNG